MNGQSSKLSPRGWRWLPTALIAVGLPKCVGCVAMYLSIGKAVELCGSEATPSRSWPLAVSLIGVAVFFAVRLRAPASAENVARIESVMMSNDQFNPEAQ